MKSKYNTKGIIVDEYSWKPSTFYTSNITLKWIFNVETFKDFYTKKNRLLKQNEMYAIHKDVYKAFELQYKTLFQNKTYSKKKKHSQYKKRTKKNKKA